MKKFLDTTRTAFYIHWLLIIKIMFMSVVSLGTAWQTSTANINVASLTKYELLNIFIGMSIIWGTNMISLFDKIITDFVKGKLPTVSENGNGKSEDTQIITKAQVNEKSTTP